MSLKALLWLTYTASIFHGTLKVDISDWNTNKPTPAPSYMGFTGFGRLGILILVLSCLVSYSIMVSMTIPNFWPFHERVLQQLCFDGKYWVEKSQVLSCFLPKWTQEPTKPKVVGEDWISWPHDLKQSLVIKPGNGQFPLQWLFSAVFPFKAPCSSGISQLWPQLPQPEASLPQSRLHQARPDLGSHEAIPAIPIAGGFISWNSYQNWWFRATMGYPYFRTPPHVSHDNRFVREPLSGY